MKSKLLVLAAALAGLLHTASAQVAMRLDFVSWGDEITGLTLKRADKGEPVSALAFRYSKPVAYNGAQILEIHQDPALAAQATAGANNAAPVPAELARRRAEEPTLVALARLPANSSRATILIAPAGAGTYQTHVIDDDPAKLPAGRLRILNYSPIKIAMRCNGRAMKEMKTRDEFLVAPHDGQVIYELAYDDAGTWTMQENNLLSVAADEQVQLIVLKSDADFFTSGDGSQSGFLQIVTLRRPAKDAAGGAP